MEQEYSVGIQNRYAFLDEDDPGDILSAAKLPKESKEAKPTKAKEKAQQPTKTEQNKSEKSEKTTSITNNQRTTRNERNDRRENKKNAGSNVRKGDDEEEIDFVKEGHPPPRKSGGRQRLASKEKENKEQGEGVTPSQGGDSLENRPFQNNRGPRRGGFDNRGGTFEGRDGPREGRGGGGFREGGRGGKREFERRSGSDKSSVKPVEKREGGGPRNWGNVKDEVEARNEWVEESETVPKVANGVVSENKGEEGAPAVEGEQKKEGEEKAEDGGEKVEEEEEDKEITYEEYMALKSKTRAKPEYQERKVNSAEESTQWKGTVPLEKKDEEFFSGTREIIEKPKTSGRVKTVVTETSFYFKDPGRRGGGFGGRGRGFGGDQERSGQGEGGFGNRERRGNRGFNGGNREGGGPRSFTADEREKREQQQQQQPGEEGESTERTRSGFRGGRGARGGGRPYAENAGKGRSGRGGGRERAPNVDDERDFPSLSAAPNAEKSEP